MKVDIKKLDNFGRGITYINNKICFVENALPEEIVEIDIVKDNKKYSEGIVSKYIEKSSMRIEEECPYSSICGGCQLNHLCFNGENTFKYEKVKDILNKYGGVPSDKVKNIVYHERNNYRNKIVLHGKDKKLGLYHNKSNDIIPIKECLLVNPKINEIISLINNLNKDVKEVIIKISNVTSKILVSIEGEITDINKLKEVCDVLFINGSCYTDSSKLLTSIGIKKYYQGKDSFFQVNCTLTKDLYDEVLFNIKDKNYRNVLDLYCGTGTIGIYISDYVDRVIGIDYNISNIDDANANKELNNISNIEFICDRVEYKINEFIDIDCIIVDPPRMGLDNITRKYLKKISPKQIIYVSCDPITLARDIKDLRDTYEVLLVRVFNMFPRTYHCEVISILERK